MSLINQALKKTQSSLSRQKLIARQTPIHSTTTTLSSQCIATPFTKRKNTPQKSIAFLAINKYWVIAAISSTFFTMVGFETHLHFASVKAHYANFYGKIFTDFLSKPKKATLVVAPQPIILDGTMEMDNKRVALINGKLYHAGQTVSDYQIKQIHYNGVVLQNTATHQVRELTPELAD